MGNYNPRQNTMMRFKDARELENFKFITGNYDFDNEVLESASTDPLYKPLIDLIMESNNYNRKTKQFGIIVNDSPAAQFVYVGTINGYLIDMYALGTNIIFRVNMTYKPATDTLTINYTEENLISEDNVKTIFGQSISGTGNIELYRHQLTLHSDEAEHQDMGLIVYSSSNLNVDSLQDLTTLLKPNSNTLYFAFAIHSTNIETYKVIYDNNIWKMGYDDESTGKPKYVINSVSDIVTPI